MTVWVSANCRHQMTSRTATLIGLTAILMWSLLGGADGGDRKNSRLSARCDDIRDRRAGRRADLDRAPRGAARLAAAAAGLDCRGRRPVRLSRAVFPRAALRAARRSGTAELSLAAIDRAVLVAVARRAAGAAPHHRRAARACRHCAAVCRQPSRRFRARSGARTCRRLRRGLRVGGLFGNVAQAQGGADRRGGGLLRWRPRCWQPWCTDWSRTRYGPRR